MRKREKKRAVRALSRSFQNAHGSLHGSCLLRASVNSFHLPLDQIY